MTEGELWQEQRRFAVRHLKDLGFGKSSLEGLMIEEIAELIADVQVSLFFSFHVGFKVVNRNGVYVSFEIFPSGFCPLNLLYFHFYKN